MPKITVWFDDISQDKGFIVDIVEKDNCITLNVFNDMIDAINWAKQYANKRNIKFEDLTQSWQFGKALPENALPC
jgi:hypothetical protein